VEDAGRTWTLVDPGGRYSLVMGEGGWTRFYGDQTEDGFLGADVYLRFGERDGRLEIAEIRIKRNAGVTGRFLQRLPLGRIETAIGGLADFSGELRRRVASDGDKATADADSFFEGVVGDRPSAFLAPRRSRRTAARLNHADVIARKKPDRFYQQVADLFTWLSAQSKHPALDIAEENHVPATTVHRWVKEARRRGYLQPSRRGTPVKREDS